VLLGRARLHHAVVSGRTHARRDVLDLAAEGAKLRGSLQTLDGAGLRRLTRALGGASSTPGRELEAEVERLLRDDAARAAAG